jgi:VWFA-related protein
MVPRQEVVRQLKNKIREDAWIGNSEYRTAMQDLVSLVRSLAGSGRGGLEVEDTGGIDFEEMQLEEKIQFLGPLLDKLDDLRQVEQDKLLDFAAMLKEQPGQKTVFLFYQREFLPKIEPKTLQTLVSMNQAAPQIQMTLASYMDFYRRDLTFNVDSVKQAYADSSIGIHFLYFTHPAENIPGLAMEEHSEDIYSAFKEMAAATGGLATSSANPEFLFQKAADAAENYYLLYYTPQSYNADGKFRNIRVRIKGSNYRVTHRAGYFAD